GDRRSKAAVAHGDAQVAANVGDNFVEGVDRSGFLLHRRLVSDLSSGQRDFIEERIVCDLDSLYCHRFGEFLWRMGVWIFDQARMGCGESAEGRRGFRRDWCDFADSYRFYGELNVAYGAG